MEERLYEKLVKHSASDIYPLHMPGHKRSTSFFSQSYSIDITEIDGFDNLFHAEGILLEAQRRAARVYGAEESFYLINGSTCGILAAVSAAVPGNGKILMARNCHKAVYHAVLLNRLEADYLYPDVCWPHGINSAIRPEQVEAALAADPKIRAVLITSPTYDGVVSDTVSIAKLCHERKIPLIVDEAHGAHFRFDSFFPDSAVACGADIVINSLHKTLPSFTQTALLHVNGSLIDRDRLRKYLGIYQSSSPSYVLMAGMDECIVQVDVHRQEWFGFFTRALSKLRNQLDEMQHLQLINGTENGLYAWSFDPSKVIISTAKTSLTGPQLGNILRQRYHLEPEMEAENYVTAIMTVCDTAEGYERLAAALLEIDRELTYKEAAVGPEKLDQIPANESVLTIAQTENCILEKVSLENSGGRISGEFAYLYPPGIPYIVPGERIQESLPEILSYFQSIGLKLQGLADYTEKTIQVVKEPWENYSI